MRKSLILISFIICLLSFQSEGKKIKSSFKINKEQKENVKREAGRLYELGGVREINLSGSQNSEDPVLEELKIELRKVSFAGYDKELNSSKESFILVNPTDERIVGYKVRIDYLDMQGRMLHSQTVESSCDVPPGESRRMDEKTWDTQHTYYYYLGNEPKRVATPFQVKFIPLSFKIE